MSRDGSTKVCSYPRYDGESSRWSSIRLHTPSRLRAPRSASERRFVFHFAAFVLFLHSPARHSKLDGVYKNDRDTSLIVFLKICNYCPDTHTHIANCKCNPWGTTELRSNAPDESLLFSGGAIPSDHSHFREEGGDEVNFGGVSRRMLALVSTLLHNSLCVHTKAVGCWMNHSASVFQLSLCPY